MKGHSFVRENIVKILNYETSKQKSKWLSKNTFFLNINKIYFNLK